MAEENFSDGLWPAFLEAALLVATRLCPRGSGPTRPSHPGAGNSSARLRDRGRLRPGLALVSKPAKAAQGLRGSRADPGHAAGERAEVSVAHDRVQRIRRAPGGLEKSDAATGAARPARGRRLEMGL